MDLKTQVSHINSYIIIDKTQAIHIYIYIFVHLLCARHPNH